MKALSPLLVLILAASPPAVSATAQTFTEIDPGLVGFQSARVQWGDFDGDQDLDLLVSGRQADALGEGTRVYRNDGGVFTHLEAGLTGVQFGTSRWGDYDADGDLDVLLCGRTPLEDDGLPHYRYVTQVFANQGGGVFSLAHDLGGLEYTDADWGDYDNDGDLDIVQIGSERGEGGFPVAHTRLYRNQGGSFVEVDAGLPDVNAGAVRFADLDGDQDLDLVLTGLGGGVVTALLRNDGDGVFTDLDAGLQGLTTSAVAWADFDTDGDLDLIAGGSRGAIHLTDTRLYRNLGGGVFAEVTLQGDLLPQVSKPSFDWGDYDSDGDPDLLLTGQVGVTAQRTTALLRNDGGDVFTAVDLGLPQVRGGSARWADYDADGDLDFFLTGDDGNGLDYVARLYRNDGAAANAVPAAPAGLAAAVAPGEVVLSWLPATDAETPQAALSYNLRIGTAPGAADVVAPMASLATGFRQLAGLGNAQQNTTWRLRGLPAGTYHWSVQAVDGGLAGSPFAAEGQFTVGSTTAAPGLPDPVATGLSTVHPNPFNPQTRIGYHLQEAAEVRLQVFRPDGSLVRVLAAGQRSAGDHAATWDGRDGQGRAQPSGTYLVRLEAGDSVSSRKLTLAR